ncbi:hypothetical protein IFM89_033135 [Coptis chinensis]|uniref:Homeobox domain-containing protein n=1 Tax=Coptis chinensis TaxID=261450 RepID=A0A835HII6_9MAGN|nr:hypothetical protein IFM89_033135 [Coptis chinensis]
MQIQIREQTFDHFNQPTKLQIQDITNQLKEHSEVTETNVNKWFYNKRERSRKNGPVEVDDHIEVEVPYEKRCDDNHYSRKNHLYQPDGVGESDDDYDSQISGNDSEVEDENDTNDHMEVEVSHEKPSEVLHEKYTLLAFLLKKSIHFLAYGLLEDDSEWNDAMKQASEWANPASLEELFVTLILLCEVTSPEILFENHQKSLGEDILFRYRKTNHNQSLQLSDDQIKNDTLCEIENIMSVYFNLNRSTGVGYGGAASDHLGEVVLAFCGGYGRNYVLFQELEAIEKGLQGCQLHGFWRVEAEEEMETSRQQNKEVVITGVNATSTSGGSGACVHAANPTQEPPEVVTSGPIEGGISAPSETLRIVVNNEQTTVENPVPTVAVEKDTHITEQVTIGSELVLFQEQQITVPTISNLIGSPGEQLRTCNSFEILTNDDSDQIQITSEALVVRQRWADLVEDTVTTTPAAVPKKKMRRRKVEPYLLS